MSTALLLGCGLFWTVTYLLIIRQAIVDRTYGMPLVALAANLAWEFIFSVVRPPQAGVPHAVNIIWLSFDLVIAYTVLRFGPREFRSLPKPLFYAGFLGILVLAYLGVDLVSREFDHGAGTYAAFGSNLMMSGLFLGMLGARGTLRGQSAWIAAAKLIGTAFASLYVWQGGHYPYSALLPFLGAACFVVDLAYLAAVLLLARGVAAPGAGGVTETVNRAVSGFPPS